MDKNREQDQPSEPVLLTCMESQVSPSSVLFCRDTTPLLNKSNSDHMFETMTMEIEQLLAKVRPALNRDVARDTFKVKSKKPAGAISVHQICTDTS